MKKILNIGSLNTDYVYAVDHFVRPGETISAVKRSIHCGGKGLNQSVAAALAGADIYHAGKIGPEGDLLLDCLKRAGVHTDMVIQDDGITTGHATIQVTPQGQNAILVYAGANRSITESDVDAALKNFGPGDILLAQNETSCVDYALRKATQMGMLTALNPSPIDSALAQADCLRYVHWFIVNEIEGRDISGETDPKRICWAIWERYSGAHVLLTLGKDGCLYFDGERFLTHGTYDVQPLDTTGAGDTFTGYFIACIANGQPVETALELASRAASIAVGRAGAAESIPALAEVRQTDLTPSVSNAPAARNAPALG